MVNAYKIIIYSGILAFLFFVAALLVGLFGLDFRYHLMGAILGCFFALIHVGIIFYGKIKTKIKK